MSTMIPPPTMLHGKQHPMNAPWMPGMEVEHIFISKARSFLAGVSPGKGLQAHLVPGLPLEEVERILQTIATEGNSDLPVAERLQRHPANVAALIQDPESITAASARRGVTYQMTERPRQHRRPHPLRLEPDQELAASTEIARLFNVCKAIEVAPLHDGDKCLREWAKAYERQPLPRGKWPSEKPIPVCRSETAVDRYNKEQMEIFRRRRARGMPLRDFESGVFCVAKSDGGYRLCTDYRELNKFSQKQSFQMEGVQEVAELIQRRDYGMLIDLKDCYLTMGLHPSQRKYRTAGSRAPPPGCVTSGRQFPSGRQKRQKFARKFCDRSYAY